MDQSPPYLPRRRHDVDGATISGIVEHEFLMTRYEGFVDLKVCTSRAIQEIVSKIANPQQGAAYSCWWEVHARTYWHLQGVKLVSITLQEPKLFPLLTVDIDRPSDLGEDINTTIRLKPGSVVAVIVAQNKPEDMINVDFIFMRVYDRKTIDGKFQIALSWEQDERYQDLASLAHLVWRKANMPLSISIVEVANNIYPTWPVLGSSLQNLNLPTRLKSSRFKDPTEVEMLASPPTLVLDFFNIKQPSAPNALMQWPTESTDRTQWIDDLLKKTILQSTQAAAVFEILTKTRTVIQGPPGSGKSWITCVVLTAIMSVERTMQYLHRTVTLTVGKANDSVDKIYAQLRQKVDRMLHPDSTLDLDLMATKAMRLGGQSKQYQEIRDRAAVREQAQQILGKGYVPLTGTANMIHNSSARTNVENTVSDRVRYHNDRQPSFEIISEYLRTSKPEIFNKFEGRMTFLDEDQNIKGESAKGRIKKTFRGLGRKVFLCWVVGQDFESMVKILKSKTIKTKDDDSRPLDRRRH